MATIQLDERYGWVAATVAYNWIMHHMVMSYFISSARKEYGIKYPALYASKENCEKEEHIKAFNSVQRGHQNALESLGSFLALLLIAGLAHPITAAAAGVWYITWRFVYFRGYSLKGPGGRYAGMPAFLGVFVLLGICIKMAITTGLSAAT